MSAYQAGNARVSSTVTKRNPRPRKYASASERQAAYRARAPEVCFRAEAKTVQTLDSIAETLDQPRADLLLSMTKFALANHDWARFGLTHRPLPYGYGLAEQEFIGPRQANPQPIWKRTRPKSLGKPVPLTPKQKAAAKKRAAAAGRKYPNLVDNIAAARMENPTMKKLPVLSFDGDVVGYAGMNAHKQAMALSGGESIRQELKVVDGIKRLVWVPIKRKENPTMKKPTPAQLAARARFAEMARSGAFKRKAKKAKANPAKKTVSQKISQLTREGYPQKQAVAIALSEQRAGKVKATPRKRNPISQVAQTIYEQIGGGRFAAMTGAKNFVAGEDFLQFSIPRNQSGANKVRISYHYGSDFYTLAFIKVYKDGSYANVQVFEDATADQLQPLFTQVTGMYTSLGTMGRKTNPATGRKGSGTKLNPSSTSRVKYVCIAPLEYSGAKYGIDERTPVTMKFSKTEPAAHLVHTCYQLPSRLVQSDDFQNFAYHNKVIYMSLAELKMLLKGYMK